VANQIHPNSKQAMCAFARKSITGLIQMLSEAGMSYADIETELRLDKRDGMTAWELVNKKRAKTEENVAP
jgi:hypothetical protein